MKLQLANGNQDHLIRSCVATDTGFQLEIGDTKYSQSLILTPRIIEMWSISDVSNLHQDDFHRLGELPVEVVLLGTGNTISFPDVSLTQPLINKGIGLEVMDTPAACRTYNILIADGRNPAVALIN